MFKEELGKLFFYAPNKYDAVSFLAYQEKVFNLSMIDSEFIERLLHVNHLCSSKIKSVKTCPLPGGFNVQIGGGGVYRIDIERAGLVQWPETIFLKVRPSFKNFQEEVFHRIRGIGHDELVKILQAYPSNHQSKNEMMSYVCLPGKLPLRMPKLFLGIINEQTEQSWIFMEDLSGYEKVSHKLSNWDLQSIRLILKEMADFHAVFWGKSNELDSMKWLGRWWLNKENDFVSKKVASYILDQCVKIHPSLLTRKRISLFKKALQKRDVIHNYFIQGPQTLIHWDFAPHNMRLDKRKKGNKELIVFDWEQTSMGLPQWDIAQFLMPILGKGKDKVLNGLINDYLNYLPKDITKTINIKNFKRDFDLVVLDHFFRVCWPIFFEGENIDREGEFFSEWQNCLEWVETNSAHWL